MNIIKLLCIVLAIFLIFMLYYNFIIKDKDEEEETYNIVFEYEYIPTTTIEAIDGIMPDDIYDLDEFNKNACLIAQTLYGESRGLSTYEQSMVVWCILNRLDSGRYQKDIESIIKAPNQFTGYHEKNPVDAKLYNIAVDVLMRWSYEKYLMGESGRTLPKEYIGFYGKNGHNYFRDRYGNVYGFTADDPYGDNIL